MPRNTKFIIGDKTSWSSPCSLHFVEQVTECHGTRDDKHAGARFILCAPDVPQHGPSVHLNNVT